MTDNKQNDTSKLNETYTCRFQMQAVEKTIFSVSQAAKKHFHIVSSNTVTTKQASMIQSQLSHITSIASRHMCKQCGIKIFMSKP